MAIEHDNQDLGLPQEAGFAPVSSGDASLAADVWKSVLDASGVGAWEYDHRQDRVEWNAALSAMTGLAPGQTPKNMDEWLVLVHQQDRPALQLAVAAALSADTPIHSSEYRLRKHDGAWLWVSAKGRVIRRDGQGRPVCTAGIVEDISRRKHTECLLKAQHGLTLALAGEPNRDTLLHSILDSALSLPEFDAGGVYWRQQDGDYSLLYHQGLSEGFIRSAGYVAQASWQADFILKGKWLCSCQEPLSHCTDSELVLSENIRREGIRALVVLPIHADGKPVACLNLASKQEKNISRESLEALQTLAAQFNLSLRRIMMQEESVRQSENLQALFEALDDYLFVVGLDGSILHYNQAVSVRLGYGRQLVGQPIWMIHPESMREEAKGIMADMVAGKRKHCPLPLQNALGETIAVDTRIAYGHWSGKPAIFGIARDISEQVAHREALRQREQFTSDIVNSLPGIFYVFDQAKRLIRWNARFAALTGLNPDQLKGMAGADFFMGEDKHRVAAAIAEVYADGQSSVEADFLTADGCLIPHYFTGSRTVIDGETYLVGLGIDISCPRKTQQALEFERSRLRTLVETIPDLVWLKDPDGVYLACNLSFERLYGAEAGQVIGHKDEDFVAGDTAAVFRRHDRAAIAAGQPTRNEEWLTFVRDGYRGLFETIKTPMRDAEGHLVGVLGVARDITELRRRQDALSRSETLLRTTLDATADGILVVDESGSLLAMNRRFRELWHIPVELAEINPDELLLKHIAPQLADPERFLTEVRQIYQSDGERWDTLALKDGQFFERFTRPIHLNGQQARLWAFRNVTDRHIITEALHERVRLQQRLEQIVASAPGIVFSLSMQANGTLCFPYASPAIGDMLGLNPKALEADASLFWPLVHPTDRERVRSSLLGAIKNLRPWREEFRVRTQAKGEFWVEVRSLPEQTVETGMQLHGFITDITEGKMAERALEQTAMFLRQSQMIAKVGGWKVNPIADTVLWTEEVYRLVERPLDRPHVNLTEALVYYAPAFLPTVKQKLIEAWENGTPFCLETEMIAASGRHFWAELRCVGRVVEDAGVFITGTFQDISERKQIESALRVSQERLNYALTGTHEGLWDWNMETNEVYLSPRWKAMLGYGEHELDNWFKTWENLVHPDDKVPCLRHLNEYLHGKIPRFEFEFRMRHKAGHWVDILARAKLACDAAGRPVFPRRLVGTHYDISERKRTEEHLRQLSTVVEQGPVSVVITDLDSNILYVNPRFTNVTGYSLNEAMGKNPRLLKSGLTPPTTYQNMWRALSRGRPWHGELLNRKKTGEIFWEEAFIAPVFAASGRQTHYVAIKLDITQRKSMENAFKELNDSLERRVLEESFKNREKDHLLIQQSRFAAMGEMIGNIAHQWRQPLNTLGLTLANIEDAFLYGELTPEYLAKQAEEGKRLIQKMSSTIDDFRNFFRPNKDPSKFSAAKAIQDAVSLVSASFKNHHIDIALELGEDVFIHGFSNEFSQVLLNLFSNAKDAILRRSVRDGKVWVKLAQDGQSAVVTIADNGGGVAEPVLGKIFEPYFSTKENGTGIGLYMSKMIIEKSMGGRISVRNIEQGAEFSVCCPLSAKAGSSP